MNRVQFLQFGIFLLTLCIKITTQQRPGFGACPDPPTIFEFDLKKFQGKWYEIERSFYIFETVGQCASFNFSLNEDGTLNVMFIMKNRLTGNMNTYTGEALPEYDKNPSIWDFRLNTRWTKPSSPSDYWFSSSFPTSLARILPGSGKYYILGTNYDSYAIMWSCSNMGILHSDLVWVLSRKKELAPLERHEVYAILNDLQMNPDRLVLTKQDNCPQT